MLKRKRQNAVAVLSLARKTIEDLNDTDDDITSQNPIFDETSKQVEEYENNEMYKEMSHLIPGLNIITSKEASLIYKSFWALILALCLLLCLFQFGNRIHVYLSDRTVFRSKVTVNDTVRLPTFTICANKVYASLDKRKKYAAEKGEKDFCRVHWTDMVGFNGQDVSELWKSYQTRDIINVTKFPEAQVYPDKIVVKRTTIPTFLGMCVNLDVSENVIKYEYGHITYLRITFIEPEYPCDYQSIKIRIHSPEDCIKHEMLRESLEVPIGFYTDLIITSYKKIIFKNKKKNPCSDKNIYRECMKKCLNSLLATGLKCRLPFMDVNLPYCKDKKSTEYAYRKAEETYNNNPQCPQCSKRCVEDKFTTLMSPWRTGQKDIMLGIFYKENTYQTAMEVPEYEFIALVADIGGSVGLFLGFCIIHLLELFDTMITNLGLKLYKWIIRKDLNKKT